MSLQNISINKLDLNQLHRTLSIPIGDLFAKPIIDGMLNRSTLIRGLTNMKIHEGIDNYFCFTELSLNSLELKNINIVGDYISLKKIVLRQNRINDLNALNSLKELEYLDVSHNCLEQLLNFNPPKMLYYVDYSNNNIKYMNELTNFWSLAYLDLSYNTIKHIYGLQKLKYLTFLNLSHNCIEHVNGLLPQTLIEIDLSYNDLEYIQLDMSSSMCEILNVSYNKLKLLNFLKNAKQLSILYIQNNMIDDVYQIEYLKPLKNLRILNAENNKFVELNIHEQIFSNNIPLNSVFDKIFIKEKDLQVLNEMEIYTLLMAKKNAIKSTVLKHLSGRSPLGNNNSHNCRLLSMIILVGPPKSRKKYFLNQIFLKHSDKFYRAFIYTTNNATKNRIYKTITVQEFNNMNSNGEFVFNYQLLGNSYGLNEDQLFKCINLNKILITFTNLEGALSLKLKGYNPTFVLVLPEDKIFYKKNIYHSVKKYINQKSLITKNKIVLEKKTTSHVLNTEYNTSLKSEDFTFKSLAICPSDTNKNVDDNVKLLPQNSVHFEDNYSDSINLNDPCMVFANECINNVNVCYNLYEKTTDIFHSLIYVDNFNSALKIILTIMIDVYNSFQINQKSETLKLSYKHMLEHIQVRHKKLYNELFE